jgi:hypothetical protein
MKEGVMSWRLAYWVVLAVLVGAGYMASHLLPEEVLGPVIFVFFFGGIIGVVTWLSSFGRGSWWPMGWRAALLLALVTAILALGRRVDL